MAHRTYRLVIGPETAPDIRRVVELDGRSSLGQLHAFILHAFGLPPGRELYGFALNGRFDDDKGLYVGPGAEGQKAERALLFRLGLHAGKSFDYLLDAGAGLRFKLNVVSVSDAAEPLAEPVLVESLGTLPPETLTAEDVHQSDPDDVAELVPPAEAFLDAHDELEPFDQELTTLRARLEPWEHEDSAGGAARGDEQVPALALAALQTAADAALALLPLVAEDLPRFLRLDHWLIERSLGQRLLDLPLELSAVGEHERALAVSKAITFIDPELTRGDTAIVLARAGRREEALAQLNANLDDAKDKSLVEAKAGDTYRALGDLVAAEAYYRRSLAEAETDFDRRQAVLRIVSCLLDTGRAGEASQLLAAERARTPADDSLPSVTTATPAGRNDPCPCGSGKKYKKCHGYG